MLTTEVEFTLPCGYQDGRGVLHKEGTMRMATAADEVLAAGDPRVRSNPAYLTIIVLSRVIVRLGEVESINPKVIEGMFAADIEFLQDLYDRLNGYHSEPRSHRCPSCNAEVLVEGERLGGSEATP